MLLLLNKSWFKIPFQLLQPACVWVSITRLLDSISWSCSHYEKFPFKELIRLKETSIKFMRKEQTNRSSLFTEVMAVRFVLQSQKSYIFLVGQQPLRPSHILLIINKYVSATVHLEEHGSEAPVYHN